MVEADGHPLTELIEDIVLWAFRLVRLAVNALKSKNTWTEPTVVWVPHNNVERAVYAALILAGEPVNNGRLAALMGVSPAEASRRVRRLDGFVSRARRGRQVLISLN
jgi:hypothetical protein